MRSQAWEPLFFFLVVVVLAYHASAQQLRFLQPNIGAVSGVGLPHYTVGQDVKVQWTSTFDSTTLLVYQERLDGSYVSQMLADRYPKSQPNTTWRVAALQSAALGGAFHFMLENAENSTCSGCTLNSKDFNVTMGAVTSSATAPATSSVSSSSVTSPQSSAPATASTVSAVHKNIPSSKDLSIGLGIGLGVGIPLLLAILGFMFCCFRRRKIKESPSPPQEVRSVPGSSTTWLQQPMLERVHTDPSGAHRPSFAGKSDTSGWSHTSWIEPFDFESAAARDQDAMSQLRQSIYSARASERSSSNVDHALDDIPEAPQPAYSRGPYANV